MRRLIFINPEHGARSQPFWWYRLQKAGSSGAELDFIGTQK